jgi:hypothetical protein
MMRWRRAAVIALSLLTAGCATAFEYPKTGQAWGQISVGR